MFSSTEADAELACIARPGGSLLQHDLPRMVPHRLHQHQHGCLIQRHPLRGHYAQPPIIATPLPH